MNEKKVIVFIVEGPSDEAAIGSTLCRHTNMNLIFS